MLAASCVTSGVHKTTLRQPKVVVYKKHRNCTEKHAYEYCFGNRLNATNNIEDTRITATCTARQLPTDSMYVYATTSHKRNIT